MHPGRKLRSIVCLIAAFFAGSLSGLAYGLDTQRHDYEIVAADDSEATRRIVADLRKQIPVAQLFSSQDKHSTKGKSPVYIAIGPAGLRAALTQGSDGVILSLYTSSQVYHAILDGASEPHPKQITAIYAEPSPSDQLRLISMISRKQGGVAVILSNKTAYLEPILQGAAAQLKTPLTVEKFNDGDNINRVLSRIADVPTILAMPDSAVFNAENIRNILVTTYRRSQPVIGFSAPLVKAGALASSYSDIEDIDAQADEILNEFDASGKLPDPQFPRYFSVIVNDDVARSLNIVVDDSVKKFARKPTVRQP